MDKLKEKKKEKKNNSSQTEFWSINYAGKLCNSPLHPEIRKTEIQTKYILHMWVLPSL